MEALGSGNPAPGNRFAAPKQKMVSTPSTITVGESRQRSEPEPQLPSKTKDDETTCHFYLHCHCLHPIINMIPICALCCPITPPPSARFLDAFCNVSSSRISNVAKCLQCEGCRLCRTCPYSCKGCMCLKAIFLKIHSESSKPEFASFGGLKLPGFTPSIRRKLLEIVKLIITAAAFVLSEHIKGAKHVWNIGASKPLWAPHLV